MTGNNLDIAKYRFVRAKDDLESAIINLQLGKFKTAVNRSYYAIFHAIRAINSLNGFDSRKHSGVISYFNKNFVKSGLLSVEMSKIVGSAIRVREKADYDDFYMLSIEDTREQVEAATEFLVEVEKYLLEVGVI